MRGTEEINVIEKQQPSPLEIRQPPALFDWVVLYWMQPKSVKRAHFEKLRAMGDETKRELMYLDMALIERTTGLENSSDEWVEWYEEAQDLTDEEIQERIDFNRDRMLTIIAHRSLSIRSKKDLIYKTSGLLADD